jgi:diaminohydroxyphosphoribosylaminopyrimidine deaminase/5-amino-6-(5-phosphoribosylamino)uracil reductase
VTDTTDDFDRTTMRRAIALARAGLGTTAPNPSVGAVVVARDGRHIIAEGATCPGGRPHAETVALAAAGDAARGATLYVTLEPCSHHGKTPPCADAVVAAGLARVVCALGDPDLRVSGRGFARLREAGIAVTTGVLEDEARWVTLGHILRVTRNRPFIQVKVAVGADGLVPLGTRDRPYWITGDAARHAAHLLRAEADAIMVGAGTVRADDPALTCRIPGLEARSPIRIVAGAPNAVAPGSKLWATADRIPVWVLSPGERALAVPAAGLRSGLDVIAVDGEPGTFGRLDLRHAMRALAQRGITRLMIEGGPTLVGALYDADLIDEFIVFEAPADVGAARGSPPIGGRGLSLLADPTRWQTAAPVALGPDTMLSYRRRRS